jgi:hypothetical protein
MLLLLALLPAALAARLELALDTPTLQPGQTVALQVQLVDGQARGLPDLEVPDGVDARYSGQATSTVVVNFDTTRIVRYTYALTAGAPGTYALGPARMIVDGRPLESNVVEVTVAPRDPEAPTGSGVSATLSDDTPYLGQVVLFEAEYRRVEQVLDARWTLPEFDGFIDEKTVEGTRKEYATTLEGQQVVVEEITLPLVAVGEGRRAIGRAGVTAQIPVRRRPRSRRDMFFERTEVRTETWTSEPMEVTVQPLPEQGRPADFGGLVGRFSVKATPSSRSVALGESVTVEVRVEGDGTLSGFTLPPLPDDAGLRAYDDEPERAASLAGGRFRTVATFRRAIVPEQEGQLVVPPVRITSFDPVAGAYITVESDPIPLDVRPGEGAGTVTSYAGGDADQRRDVEALGDDILPAPGDASVRDRTLSAALPLALGLPAVPALVLAGLLLSGRRREAGPDPRAALRADLAALPAEPRARLQALERIFRAAAALRLGVPAPGLDRAAVAPLGPDADRLYGDLDAARYGGGADADLEARVRTFAEEALA